MASPRSNRLLPVLGGAVLLMLVFVTLRSCGGGGEGGAVMEAVPTAPAPDADTPADTIMTLTANVASMESEVGALRQENEALRLENRTIAADQARIEENVTVRLRREIDRREQEQAEQARSDAGMLGELSARVDRLADTVARSPQTGAGSDIPVGLGLDGVGMASNLEGALVWIEPLDGAARGSAAPGGTAYGETGGDFLDSPEGGGPFDYGLETTAGAMNEPGLARAAPAAQAVYTVPRNATLMGAVAMTALVGRVPIDGQVRDPMPFKAIAGVENLAANGLSVPGVQGMVFSGTAVGDWTLSCVTGRIESVTFVFDDGTIRTLPGPDPNEGNDGETAMGWISDERGIPCVGGERKTNAAAFLSQRMGVQAVQAAADAAAAAETTSIVALGNTGGRVTGAVTGDPGRYVLGNTLAGGSEEIARWLAERQSQHFDAVFVAAGTPVAIHIERQLDIDHDPQGRRLDHGFSETTDNVRGLD